jgi:hypothetical protein
MSFYYTFIPWQIGYTAHLLIKIRLDHIIGIFWNQLLAEVWYLLRLITDLYLNTPLQRNVIYDEPVKGILILYLPPWIPEPSAFFDALTPPGGGRQIKCGCCKLGAADGAL